MLLDRQQQVSKSLIEWETHRVDAVDCTLAHFSRLLVLSGFDFLFFSTTKMMIMTTMETKRTAPIAIIPYMSAEITDLKIICCTNTTEKPEKSILQIKFPENFTSSKITCQCFHFLHHC